ncbi:MAG TPA: Hsp20/alpha crystallin family protein [Syntrophorhabdaceae bacterium]|jgi:HSP20 family protein
MLWTEGFGTFGSGLDPWAHLERMENEMNRVLSRYSSPSVREFPAVNVWTETDQAVVTSEVPGIDSQSLDISVTGKTLTLRGSRDQEPVTGEESYHRRERWYGQFSRVVELPFNVEADKVKAQFKKGVLFITLPRAESEKPRKISIQSE